MLHCDPIGLSSTDPRMDVEKTSIRQQNFEIILLIRIAKHEF